MTRLTTQKLHSIIQKRINKLSTKYSVSEKINRTTYDVCTRLRGTYGVMSSSYLPEIIEALKSAGIEFDDSCKDRGFIKVPVRQA